MSASVEGFGFNDADGDGTRDSDEIDLFTVYAYVDLNNSGVLDLYEPKTFFAGTTLPPPSNYLIQDLPAGTYTVDAANKTITLQIVSASFPNIDGTTQLRRYTLSGDELTWKVPPRPDGSVPVSSFTRVR